MTFRMSAKKGSNAFGSLSGSIPATYFRPEPLLPAVKIEAPIVIFVPFTAVSRRTAPPTPAPDLLREGEGLGAVEGVRAAVPSSPATSP